MGGEVGNAKIIYSRKTELFHGITLYFIRRAKMYSALKVTYLYHIQRIISNWYVVNR